MRGRHHEINRDRGRRDRRADGSMDHRAPAGTGRALPPMFAVGRQVVGPAGQVITIAAVHGEWIRVEVPDKLTNLAATIDPLTGNTLMLVGQWMHVPSALMWGATP